MATERESEMPGRSAGWRVPECVRRVTLTNPCGLHAAAAVQLAATAIRFKAETTVICKVVSVSALHPCGLLMLKAGRGSLLCIHGRGEEAEAAVLAISRLIQEEFQEG